MYSWSEAEADKSKMVFFVTIVTGFHLLIIFTKTSILDAADLLDPALDGIFNTVVGLLIVSSVTEEKR